MSRILKAWLWFAITVLTCQFIEKPHAFLIFCILAPHVHFNFNQIFFPTLLLVWAVCVSRDWPGIVSETNTHIKIEPRALCERVSERAEARLAVTCVAAGGVVVGDGGALLTQGSQLRAIAKWLSPWNGQHNSRYHAFLSVQPSPRLRSVDVRLKLNVYY